MQKHVVHPPLCLSPSLCRCIFICFRRQHVRPSADRTGSWRDSQSPSSHGFANQPATPGLVSCQTLFEHNIIWTFQSVDTSRRMPLGQFETTDRRTQQDTLIPTLFIKSDSFQYQQSNTYQHLLSPAARLSAD